MRHWITRRRRGCGSSASGRSRPARRRREADRMEIPKGLWPTIDRLFKGHVMLYRATNGVIGHRVPGIPPMLLLDHVGAKTGTPRTTPLVYIRDGDDYVIVASKGGYEKNPA